MTDVKRLTAFLRDYDGPEAVLMEVCGTHTAAISENGIPALLSPKIRLVSGPGCPVCVTVAAYIDRLTELAMEPDTCVVTFGDLMRVRGSKISLRDAEAAGGRARMVYSPLDVLALAEREPETTFVFAAVGFETTTPVYALLLDTLIEKDIRNVKLLTALKTMPAAIDWICAQRGGVTGFIAPGHVSVITGSDLYKPLAEKWGLPFSVAGFSGPELLYAICRLILDRGRGVVTNCYPSAVTAEGNRVARERVARYFRPCAAAWRGIGILEDSGMELRDEYLRFDAGSRGLVTDQLAVPGCCCGRVIVGSMAPTGCPLFGRACTPQTPQGACMVSLEGSCYNYFINKRS